MRRPYRHEFCLKALNSKPLPYKNTSPATTNRVLLDQKVRKMLAVGCLNTAQAAQPWCQAMSVYRTSAASSRDNTAELLHQGLCARPYWHLNVLHWLSSVRCICTESTSPEVVSGQQCRLSVSTTPAARVSSCISVILPSIQFPDCEMATGTSCHCDTYVQYHSYKGASSHAVKVVRLLAAGEKCLLQCFAVGCQKEAAWQR